MVDYTQITNSSHLEVSGSEVFIMTIATLLLDVLKLLVKIIFLLITWYEVRKLGPPEMYRNLEGELVVLDRYVEEEPPSEILNTP